MAPDSTRYRGRFAPSPTGPLHFGSLVAAVGSYLDALYHDGKWLVRIEDIDPPREQAGAADSILRSLERHGFEWDGPVLYQSTCTAAYEQALAQLVDLGVAYPCSCSRRDIMSIQPVVNGHLRYPGTCRQGRTRPDGPAALRVLTDNTPITFEDRLQGKISVALESEDGDFVVKRKDGLFAYQLAVVVDDHAQGITDVVRGVDLLDSTPRQIHLQRLLGLPPVRYAHLPIVIGKDGSKLSKQTGATALDDRKPAPSLLQALTFLGQRPPALLQRSGIGDVWQWARENWRPEAIKGTQGPGAPWGSAQ